MNTSMDVDETIAKIMQEVSNSVHGLIQLNTTRKGLVRFSIGRLSSADDELFDNFTAALNKLSESEPQDLTKRFVSGCFMCTQKGGGVKIRRNTVDKASPQYLGEVDNKSVEQELQVMEVDFEWREKKRLLCLSITHPDATELLGSKMNIDDLKASLANIINNQNQEENLESR